jgi:uncharacterized protein CbrC (UPF0167 family)
MAYRGRIGHPEIGQHPDALMAVRDELRAFDWPGEQVDEYVEGLDANGSPTAYLFTRLHCGAESTYSDID